MEGKTGIFAIFGRECKRIFSSKICIWGIFVSPLLSMIILVWMMDSGLPTKIPIAVVDLDNSTTSRSLIRQLDAFPKTDIKVKDLSFAEARHQMEQMNIYAILMIPQDFAKDATSGNQPKLVYYTNNSFLVSGSLLFQDLKTVSTLAAASVGLKTGTAKGYVDVQIMPIVQPISIKSYPQGNPWLNYSIYLNNVVLPGILQLVILLFTVSAFGSEIKSGSAQHLMALGKHSICKVMIGKLLPYTIIYMCIALCFMFTLYVWNGFPLRNGFLPMFANYLCLIVATQGFGLILLAVFANYRMAISLSSLLGMVSFSISGFSFPTPAMDPSLQALTNLFPLRHFFNIYVDQALNGFDIGYSMQKYAYLLCFALVAILLVGRIRKQLVENNYEP